MAAMHVVAGTPESRGSPELWSDMSRSLVSCVKELGSRRFLPESEIGCLLTEQKILSVLQATCIPCTEDVLHYIQAKARKVFLVLVWSDTVKRLKTLMNHGFYDEHLPIFKHGMNEIRSWDEEKRVWRPEAWLAFNKWRQPELDRFLSDQWMLLAPRFHEHRFYHDLEEQQPLPFIRTDPDIRKHGHFSQVFKMEVHPAHASADLFKQV